MNLYDTETDCQSVNSTDAYYIHQGKMFQIPFYTASKAAAASESVSFKTPVKGKIILKPIQAFAVANTLLITLTEGAVMSSGTVKTPVNMNRNSGNTSLVQAYSAATLTTAGTVLDYIPCVSGGNTNNGESGLSNEIELKPDTTYSLNFANVGASTASVFYYVIRWIEK